MTKTTKGAAPAEPKEHAVAGRVFIRMKALKAKTGLPESTIFYLMAKGAFPRNFKLGDRIAVWDLGEVEAWMEAHISDRGMGSSASAASRQPSHPAQSAP